MHFPPLLKGRTKEGLLKPMLPYNKNLKPLARQLRSSLTKAENIFWQKVRHKQLLGCQFYRQKTLGNYIVDFYCPAKKLVVELDGSQHYDPDYQILDQQRSAYLHQLGLKVLRYNNNEVLQNIQGVINHLIAEMGD